VILATAIALALVLSSCDRNEYHPAPLSGQEELRTAGMTIQVNFEGTRTNTA